MDEVVSGLGTIFMLAMVVFYVAFIVSWFMLVYAVWQGMKSLRRIEDYQRRQVPPMPQRTEVNR